MTSVILNHLILCEITVLEASLVVLEENPNISGVYFALYVPLLASSLQFHTALVAPSFSFHSAISLATISLHST